MKSVKLRFIRCSAHLTACSGRHRLTFFCKALFTTEMEIFLLHLYIGKNVFDDSMLVARSNNPFFVFSKLGSLKLSLDAWNLISFWLCKFLYASLFLSSHVQRELSKEQMLEEVPLVTHRQNASLLGFFLAFSMSVLNAFWPLLVDTSEHTLLPVEGPLASSLLSFVSKRV